MAALCAWAFGGVTQDVVGHDELARVDPRFESFVISHRVAWATGLMKSVTWLGSTVVLIPLVLIVGGYFVLRRRDWKPLGKLGATLLGAVLLYDLVKHLVARARPPARFEVGYRFSGFAFPSGHAAQGLAVWGMLALLTAGPALFAARSAANSGNAESDFQSVLSSARILVRALARP